MENQVRSFFRLIGSFQLEKFFYFFLFCFVLLHYIKKQSWHSHIMTLMIFLFQLVTILFLDPYCKVWLQFGDKRVEKRKTPIYKCTLNPVFNASFSYNVPWEKIRECCLDIMVMDFDNIGRNELIGRIVLAGKCITQWKILSSNNEDVRICLFPGKNGSGPSEAKHWQDMISKPRQTIVQWHRLKPE